MIARRARGGDVGATVVKLGLAVLLVLAAGCSSLTPVEQEHTIRAFTFELGKCYEQAVKKRELRVLANVDPVLCA